MFLLHEREVGVRILNLVNAHAWFEVHRLEFLFRQNDQQVVQHQAIGQVAVQIAHFQAFRGQVMIHPCFESLGSEASTIKRSIL